ncbi:MAG: flagellar protein FliT [Candidatus Competibacteraceae bacterium]|nr:flagellar protein FliT [Candidatus Competibacteraceae bacterium]
MIIASADWEQHIKLLRLLSVEMLELAEAGGWEAVSEWEEKRRALLDELLAQPTPDDIAPLLEETIRALLTSDARLVEMARAEMGTLSDNLRLIQQGRRALHAYPDF